MSSLVAFKIMLGNGGKRGNVSPCAVVHGEDRALERDHFQMNDGYGDCVPIFSHHHDEWSKNNLSDKKTQLDRSLPLQKLILPKGQFSL